MELAMIYQLGGGGNFGGFMVFRGNGGGDLSSPTEYERGSIKH